ncbi:hypothetical protein H4R33_002874 [Dimargaris cristalligena]|uniref:Uncharacterized protein n=1 Tax=Dimargaris cristalligena TaxID=215637 RepID=A0A4P9ZWR7_9FUNG|nr:hypothetical protein H4R33_002874 [Dimargaris cristalligena]RKP38094.1 hypothetical protein BJ085DRAFT_29314 [Dimargaris cristalligena]|eukprot:RKP38094.1 hypothetical protein BJ085DRAFT_29314 [Dimargaris cristalligena]
MYLGFPFIHLGVWIFLLGRLAASPLPTASPTASSTESVHPTTDSARSLLGTPMILYSYHVAYESSTRGPQSVALYDCEGTLLAHSTADFARNLVKQGSGRLFDGRYINQSYCTCDSDQYNCFSLVDGPLGSGGQTLNSYTSASSDLYPIGTTLWITELADQLLANGQHHSGCVRVDDSYDEPHSGILSLFIGREISGQFLMKELQSDSTPIVHAQVADCQPREYTDRYLRPIALRYLLFK